MRRSLLITVSLLLALVGLTAPAHADSTVVIHGLDFPVDGTSGLMAMTCATTPQPSQFFGGPTYATTDDPTFPLGTSKLGWNFDGDSSTAVGVYGYNPAPGSAGTYDLRLNVSTGLATGYAVVWFFDAADSGTFSFWVGTAPLSQSVNGWYTEDAESLSMDWHHWNGTSYDSTVTGQTRTTFVGGHGGNGDGAFQGFVFGCGNGFNLDRLRVSATGGVTTYDYERANTKTSMSASPTTITAGGSATLRGVTTADDSFNTPFSSATLNLEAKPYGSSTYSVVGSAQATYNSGTQTLAKIVVHPTKQTTYRWHYLGSASGNASYSPTVTINVHYRVTMAPRSLRVKKGRNLIVAGTIYPHRGGVRVTLQHKVGSVWRTWTSVRTTSSGSYRISKAMRTTGRFQIRVMTSSGPGNLAGTSTARRITVYR